MVVVNPLQRVFPVYALFLFVIVITKSMARNTAIKKSEKAVIVATATSGSRGRVKVPIEKQEKEEEEDASNDGESGNAEEEDIESGVDNFDKENEDDEVESESDEDEDEDEDEAKTMLLSARPLRSSSTSSTESYSFLKLGKQMISKGKKGSVNLRSRVVSSSNTNTNTNSSSSSKQNNKNHIKHGAQAAFIVENVWKTSCGSVNVIESAQNKSKLYSNDSTGTGAGKLGKQREERKRSLGKGWFDIAPAEMNETLRADMKVVQMRNYLDPKRFYKNPDKMKNIIGVGTVIEGPEEYTTQRMSKHERKQTLVGEILADRSIKDYTKRKYAEIQQDREKNSRKKKKMGQRKGFGSGSHKVRKLY